MGCKLSSPFSWCKRRFTEEGEEQLHRDERASQEPPLEELAALGALVTDEERSEVARKNGSPAAQVKKLRSIIDARPAKITALNLSGETLAEVELSVNQTVGDLERKILHTGTIDTKQFTIQLVYEESILTQQQKLRNAGLTPWQTAQVNIIKNVKPQKDPRLDQQLFMECWRGGGNTERVRDLLSKNADPNGYTFSDGDQALHVTAGRGYVEVVRLLLEAGADINVRGVAGMTPLQRASQASTNYWKGNHPEVQRLIREYAQRSN